MFSGDELVGELRKMQISHVVWLPDSTLGTWEQALSGGSPGDAPKSEGPHLIRVCREAEAWAVAAGLYLGGARPLIMIQCTGLFDSGDSLRNAVHDYGLPLFAIIGYRSYLLAAATDSAKTYTEPVLQAWNIDYRLIDTPDKLPLLHEHYQQTQQAGQAGVVLVAEGRM